MASGAVAIAAPSGPATTHNSFTQSGEDNDSDPAAREDKALEVEEDEYSDLDPTRTAFDILTDQIYLRKGDLVELAALVS